MLTTDPTDQGLEDGFDDGRDDWIQDCRPCKKHPNTLVEWGLDCPDCLAEELEADNEHEAECWGCSDDEDPNPPFNDMGYTCSRCGAPITADEADDNGGHCAECGFNGF